MIKVLEAQEAKLERMDWEKALNVAKEEIRQLEMALHINRMVYNEAKQRLEGEFKGKKYDLDLDKLDKEVYT